MATKASDANELFLDLGTPDRFDVREVTVDDGLSALFSIDVVALSDNAAVDFDGVIGRPATFRMDDDRALGELRGSSALRDTRSRGNRAWTGIVSEIHQLESEDGGLSTYAISIMPRAWLLTQRTNCRVFQQMTDLDVALAILVEWDEEPIVEVSRALKMRKYRVQYHESDWAFVSRMLEAEGLTYAFRTVDAVSRLVIAEAPERATRREDTLQFLAEPTEGTTYATALRASRRVRPGKITFADHDHRRDNSPLTGESGDGATPAEARLERFHYAPGAFRFGNAGAADTPSADDRGRTRTDPDEARRIATQAAAAQVARSQRISFTSNAKDLAPGTVLGVGGHPRTDAMGDLLVVRTVITASTEVPPSLVCEAVATRTPYRPEAITPTPVVQGVECATVVGPAGEIIHCDEFGRVRVQFHWDRYGTMDDKSSCWIHVNQPWAGNGFGAVNVPRIGQEVVVDFLGGNPEEPVIVGRIFTNLQRPPYPLPANRTQNGFRSNSVPDTGGYNEVMFEDAAGKELLRMRAELDMATRVNRDATSSIGNDRTTTIARNDRERVAGDQVSSVAGQAARTVQGDAVQQVMGNVASFVGQSRILGTAESLTSEAKVTTIVSQAATLLTVGSSTIYIGPDGIILQAAKILLNPGEEALQKAVRTGEIGPAGGGEGGDGGA
jgi:type VI secretion system secreted protein VgrG